MEARNQFRLRFVGIAIGVLAALLIWPGTRWLVRTQAACLIPGPSTAWAAASGLNSGGAGAVTRLTHAAAAATPDDFTVQLADAVSAGQSVPLKSTEKLVNLRILARRFPDRPSVYANILRFAAQGSVLIHRSDEYAMVPGAPIPTTLRHSDPEQLATFDRDAAEGERLDPENAYFPLMRAVGLFEAHRDADALKALHRAAQKPVWMEYYEDELDGEVRLQERVFGNSGVLPKIGFYAGLLLPEYAQIRAVGRMAVVSAMRAEAAGKPEEGIAIREDILRCGGLMRTEARTLIGSLVGAAVSMLALQRPEGAPVLEAAPNSASHSGKTVREHLTSPKRQELCDRLLAQYDAFLARTGHSEQSARAHAEMEAVLQSREVAFKNRDHDVFGTPLLQLGVSWWANVQVLGAAFWMLVLGAMAALLYHRNRGLRSGRPLPPWAGRGIALGSIAALLSGVIAIPAATPTPALWVGSVLLFAVLAFALPAPNRVQRLRTLGAYACALVATGCFLMLFAWHMNSAVDPIRKLVLLFISGSEPGPEPADPGFHMMFMGSSLADLGYQLAAVGAAAIVPLLAAIAFWIVSKVNGVPLSVALVRGFRGCAVPIACALFLIYAALLPITLRQESAAEDGIQQSLRHEGRYLAALNGMEWPGQIP